jgi:hypothetical protein
MCAIAGRQISETGSAVRSSSRWRRSGEGSGGGGHDLIVGDVTQMLVDVPAVPERVIELPVPIAPERVLQRLADLRPGGDCLREHRLRVGD